MPLPANPESLALQFRACKKSTFQIGFAEKVILGFLSLALKKTIEPAQVLSMAGHKPKTENNGFK